jgi:protein-tyrosine phosphatase
MAITTAPLVEGIKDRRIVMLTDFREGAIDKCACYLDPATLNPQTLTFGTNTYTPKILEENTPFLEGVGKEEARYTKIAMEHPTNTHNIEHYAIPAWKDYGAISPVLLAKLIKTIHAAQCKELQPLIVHCSAGVGRTGCFLAAYELYDRISQGRISEENIPTMVVNMVRGLRSERYGMVQVPEQYSLIYQTLIALLRQGA